MLEHLLQTLVVTAALITSTAVLASAQPAPGCPADAGAAIAMACPCDGPGGHGWKNHGGYVSCVVRFRNDLRQQGCLTKEAQRQIARCAARSTCGKEGATLCCRYDTSGTCASDGVTPGVCSNDGARSCLTTSDCITATGPMLTRHAETCTDRGGVAIGGGSVCSACPIPSPAP